MDEQIWGQPFVVVPFLPPSGNTIYVTNWRAKKRFLSKEASTFKTRMIAHIQSECLAHIGKLNRVGLFGTWYVFYFDNEDLLNRTFGSGKKSAATSRYKKMDVENRIKLVSDALATAIGIDDLHFFEGGHSKLSATLVGSPQIHIFLRETEPWRFGL